MTNSIFLSRLVSYFTSFTSRFSSFLLALFFTLLFACVLFSNKMVFANSMEVQAFDSIAGYGTEIVIKNGDAKSSQKIIIRSPSTKILTYSSVLDSAGNASFIVPADDLQVAGKYSFVVVNENEAYADGQVQIFTIYADEVSVVHSQVYAIDDSVKTGKKAKITAIVYDRFQNPISGHRVKLYSDRPADSVSYVSSDTSSENGEVSFYLSS